MYSNQQPDIMSTVHTFIHSSPMQLCNCSEIAYDLKPGFRKMYYKVKFGDAFIASPQ